MQHQFWIERWKNSEVDFHQPDVHDYLATHWPGLKLPGGSAVFVPLCGKSHDMVWIAGLGHKVIGVELSPIAVDAFFAERGLTPTVETIGSFTVKSAGPYQLWCGDLFELPKEALSQVAAVYDRAALVAFPPAMQVAYAKKLVEVVPAAAPIFLITLAFPEGEIKGPPFSTALVEVASLFGALHRIVLVECRDGLEKSKNLKERGMSRLEEALYILRRN
ncbi:MAG: thiopurine S-methyltransferase [Hyphomicrobium sp.]|jgi:thiopurine S-methyltransferase